MTQEIKDFENYITSNLNIEEQFYIDLIKKNDHVFIKIMYAYYLIKKSERGKANEIFNSISDINNEFLSYYKMVNCLLLFNENNKEECINRMEIETKDKKNKWVRLELFYLLKELEPYKAWGYLEEAIQIDENFNEAILQRVFHLDLVNDCNLIIDEILTLPQSYINSEILNYLGFAYYNCYEFENAEKIANGSLKIASNKDAFYLLGLINYEFYQNYNLALDYFNKSLDFDANQPQVITSKGWVLFDLEKIDEAENCFKMLINFGKDQEIFNQMIQFYLKANDLIRVKSLIEQSKELNNENYMNIGFEIILKLKEKSKISEDVLKSFRNRFSEIEVEWLKNMIKEYSY